jgi:hypothetical protein
MSAELELSGMRMEIPSPLLNDTVIIGVGGLDASHDDVDVYLIRGKQDV